MYSLGHTSAEGQVSVQIYLERVNAFNVVVLRRDLKMKSCPVIFLCILIACIGLSAQARQNKPQRMFPPPPQGQLPANGPSAQQGLGPPGQFVPNQAPPPMPPFQYGQPTGAIPNRPLLASQGNGPFNPTSRIQRPPGPSSFQQPSFQQPPVNQPSQFQVPQSPYNFQPQPNLPATSTQQVTPQNSFGQVALPSSLQSMALSQNTAQTDKCLVPPVQPGLGMCRGFFRRFTYNKFINKCVEFIYGGCFGTTNNFRTLEGCQAACL